MFQFTHCATLTIHGQRIAQTAFMRRQTGTWSCPTPRAYCPVPRHGLQTVPGHPLQFWFCYWLCNPAVHHGGPLDCEVDFAQQGGAEEDHQSLFEGYDLDVFAAEGFADAPLSSLQIELSLAIDFEQPRSLRVLPARLLKI